MSHASRLGQGPVLFTRERRREADVVPVLSRWLGSWRVSLHRRAFSAEELTRVYDREAYHWGGKLARLGVPRAYAGVLREALSGRERPGDAVPLAVLDCGVGAGHFSAALATVLGSRTFSLDAVDLSPQMLVEAEQRLARAGLAPRLHVADVRALPFADASFDLVIGAHVLEHLVEPGRALAEMRRVLRPGGRVVLCCTRRSSLGSLIRLKWRTHAATPDEARRWLAARGLEEVRVLEPRGHALFARLSVACTAVEPGAGARRSAGRDAPRSSTEAARADTRGVGA